MYKNVLLAIDLGEDASWEHALPDAVGLVDPDGGVLRIVTVVPDFGMTIVSSFFPDDFERKALATANEKLHEFVDAHVPEGLKVQHIVKHGAPAEEILEAAKEVSTDVIVIGSHRPGLDHALIGSVAQRVVSRASCSVLVVRG